MKTILLTGAFLVLTIVVWAQTTWYEIPTPTDKKLNAISFPTNLVGYIGGNDSLLLKSIDGGATWTEVVYSGVTFYPGGEHILNLQFFTAAIGYMVTGPYGGTYKTTDGGLTWNQLTTSGSLCFNEGLFFFDEQNGFIGGSGCFQGEKIDKMTAGVISSTTINTPTNLADHRVVDMDFLDSDFGLAVSLSGNVLRTTNGGTSWDTISSGLAEDVPLTSVEIINDTLAYAGYDDISGGGFGILMTADGGLTWSMDFGWATFYYPAYLCTHASSDGTFYSGAAPSLSSAGLIFELTNLSSLMYYDVDHPINDMNSYGTNVVFGVGDSGYVVVNQPVGNLVLNPNELLTNLSVYPNPANDELTILSPVGSGELRFSVINMAGELQLQGETVDQKISLDELPSGVFIISVWGENLLGSTRFIKL